LVFSPRCGLYPSVLRHFIGEGLLACKKTECWYFDGDNLSGALHVIRLQLSLPPPAPSLAATKSRMVTFWYLFTHVFTETGAKANMRTFAHTNTYTTYLLQISIHQQLNYGSGPSVDVVSIKTDMQASHQLVTCCRHLPFDTLLWLTLADFNRKILQHFLNNENHIKTCKHWAAS